MSREIKEELSLLEKRNFGKRKLKESLRVIQKSRPFGARRFDSCSGRFIMEKKEQKKEIKIWKPFLNSLKEPSGILLFVTNLIIIGFIFYSNLEFKDIIWIFWFESLIILFFVCLKVFFISSESYENVIRQDSKEKKMILIKNVFTGKIILVCIILFIFLIPLSGYRVFIRFLFGEPSYSIYLIPIGIFFFTHLTSFIINFTNDKNIQRFENFDKLVYEPTLRIVPIHVTILIGAFIILSSAILFRGNLASLVSIYNLSITIFFLLTKTIVDGATHYYVHK